MSRARDIADFVAEITDGTDTVETGYVINGSAKGWCSMTGGTGTVSLQSNSLNASSAVDVAQGKYSFYWTSAPYPTGSPIPSVYNRDRGVQCHNSHRRRALVPYC